MAYLWRRMTLDLDNYGTERPYVRIYNKYCMFIIRHMGAHTWELHLRETDLSRWRETFLGYHPNLESARQAGNAIINAWRRQEK